MWRIVTLVCIWAAGCADDPVSVWIRGTGSQSPASVVSLHSSWLYYLFIVFNLYKALLSGAEGLSRLTEDMSSLTCGCSPSPPPAGSGGRPGLRRGGWTQRRSASLFVRAEDAEVTVDVAGWASVEVGVVRPAEGPSGRRREAAASGEDTEETRLDGSLPTYQHTG